MKFYLIVNAGSIDLNVVRCYPYHMVLAQVYVDNAQYRRSIDWIRKQHTFRALMLDNGAHEGTVMNDESYIDIIMRLRPTEVVLPDLIGMDSRVGRERSMRFRDLLQQAVAPDYQPTLIYSPQGRDQMEVLQEYAWAIDHFHNESIGKIAFGQSYLHFCKDAEQIDTEIPREGLVNQVLSLHGADQAKFHIFGARWNPSYLYASYPNITGIDTVKPCICAAFGSSYPRKPSLLCIDNRYRLSLHSREIVYDSELRNNIKLFCHEYGATQV